MENLNVTLVLDETGSMEPIRDDTIGGFNTYLKSLQDDQAKNGGEVIFTLLKFDSNRVEKVYVGKPIQEVPSLNRQTYTPGAATPLIDACCKAIKATAKSLSKWATKPKVVFVIQTDGHENASTEFKHTDLTTMIKEKQAEGWEFVFLGAGLDAFDIASSLGIGVGSTMSYNQANSAQAFHALASNTTMYRSTGKSADMNWTTAQRTSSGDAYYDKHQGATPQTPQTLQPKPQVAATETKKAVDDITL